MKKIVLIMGLLMTSSMLFTSCRENPDKRIDVKEEAHEDTTETVIQ